MQRFGGFVAKYMRDGVLVYFGYPQAHEDDAGLELIPAVGGLKPGAPLQTRVGIATGLVVVGDLIGAGEAQVLSGRRRTSQLVYKALPSRTRSSSLIARKSFSATSSIFKTSAPRTSRA